MKYFAKGCLALLIVLFFSCKNEEKQPHNIAQEKIKQETDSILDQWHLAAAKANFEQYFNLMTADAIFIGTDASENWDKNTFEKFCKPYFESGNTWDFKSLKRNLFVSEKGNMVWFDELLDTWMGLCRGSGVLIKEKQQWKIAHYVLSPTVPNDNIEAFIELNREMDSITIEKIKFENN